jgi:DNA-binding MarR family transcriptional regulator
MNEQQKRNIQAIFRLNNALIKEKNRRLAKYNLTSIQADVLVFVLEHVNEREVNQLDVQAEFKLTNPTVSGIIDRLEDKGFLKRVRSGYDARFRRLEPLEKAVILNDALTEIPAVIESEIVGELTEKECSEFERLLWAVLRTTENYD